MLKARKLITGYWERGLIVVAGVGKWDDIAAIEDGKLIKKSIALSEY